MCDRFDDDFDAHGLEIRPKELEALHGQASRSLVLAQGPRVLLRLGAGSLGLLDLARNWESSVGRSQFLQ
jgi:hypothetical protein